MVPPDLSHKGLKLVEVRFQFQSMVWLQNSRQSLHVLHTQLEHVFEYNQNLCKAFHGKKDHQHEFENGLAFGRSAFSNVLHSDSD